MNKEKEARAIMKSNKWSKERRESYMTPEQVEQLATRPMRLRISKGKGAFAYMDDVDVEIKLADGKWYEIIYITLSDEVGTGISFTLNDQEGGAGTYPLPCFKYTYGAYIMKKCLCLIRNYSDG